MDENTQSRDKYESLVEEINYHNYRYHVLDDPVISDAAFDKLIKNIKEIELNHPDWILKNSPTLRAGSIPVSKFDKVTHPMPVLSLANAFNEDDLLSWRERISKIDSKVEHASFIIEPKIDGLTVVLHYQNGRLVLGATRGNGEIGEEITQNIRTINSIPLMIPVSKSDISIPARLVVRGEVFMSIPDFEGLNKKLMENGEKTYLNPRNTAAGSLRQLDSRITAQRPLKILAYSIVDAEGDVPVTQWGVLNYLRDLGFPVSNLSVFCTTFEQMMEETRKWQDIRDGLDFEIDGVVIKINDLNLANSLGTVGKDPRGAIALKFPAREEMTNLLDIGVNVGRTGVLTPFAILEPVEIGGVIVKQATLHNFDYIEEKDIRIGDRVLVKRAGDVIPYIIGPVVDVRNGIEKIFKPPEICPVCHQPTQHLVGEVAWYCVNAACPAQLTRNLEYFVSRSAMDIVGMGVKIGEQLVNEHIVNDVADLYRLKVEDVLPLEGFALKKAENLINSIESSKDRPLSRLITALGIHGVGEVMGAVLAKKFNNLDELAHVSVDELTNIEGVGPNIGQSIVEWFFRPQNRLILEKLRKFGVWPIAKSESVNNESLPLNGLTLVVTGTLENFSRNEIKEFIEQNGGKVTSSVSAKTDYVLVGENPGSKVDKARTLGVTIVNENEFIQLTGKR
jgi:DNA ligase (NAD+)